MKNELIDHISEHLFQKREAMSNSTKDNVEHQSEECKMHKMDKILYCKSEDCQQAVCPLCMSEKHRNHQVVNIVEKEMEAAVSGLDLLHVN